MVRTKVPHGHSTNFICPHGGDGLDTGAREFDDIQDEDAEDEEYHTLNWKQKVVRPIKGFDFFRCAWRIGQRFDRSGVGFVESVISSI